MSQIICDNWKDVIFRSLHFHTLISSDLREITNERGSNSLNILDHYDQVTDLPSHKDYSFINHLERQRNDTVHT